MVWSVENAVAIPIQYENYYVSTGKRSFTRGKISENNSVGMEYQQRFVRDIQMMRKDSIQAT